MRSTFTAQWLFHLKLRPKAHSPYHLCKACTFLISLIHFFVVIYSQLEFVEDDMNFLIQHIQNLVDTHNIRWDLLHRNIKDDFLSRTSKQFLFPFLEFIPNSLFNYYKSYLLNLSVMITSSMSGERRRDKDDHRFENSNTKVVNFDFSTIK